MTEHTPPPPDNSCFQIQLLLSEYLDRNAGQSGQSPGCWHAVEAHLLSCSACTGVFLSLREIQQHLARQIEGSCFPGSGAPMNYWKNIEQALIADPLPQTFDDELISGYIDGEDEMDGENPAVSKVIREFGHRMEAQCPIDLADTVMERFWEDVSGETTGSAVAKDEVGCLKVSPELLSTFFDGALPRAEQIGIQEHIENCDLCRRNIADFRWISEGLQESSTIPASPDYWPAIHNRLMAISLAEKHHEKKWVLFPRILKVVLPSAVAAVLLMITLSAAVFLSPTNIPYHTTDRAVASLQPKVSSKTREIPASSDMAAGEIANVPSESSQRAIIPVAYIPSSEEYLNQIHQQQDMEQAEGYIPIR